MSCEIVSLHIKHSKQDTQQNYKPNPRYKTGGSPHLTVFIAGCKKVQKSTEDYILLDPTGAVQAVNKQNFLVKGLPRSQGISTESQNELGKSHVCFENSLVGHRSKPTLRIQVCFMLT